MRPTASTAAALAFFHVANALTPAPVALQAGSWLGNDGNWSSVSFLLGSSSDESNVLVSTSLSEFWAVGSGGCVAKDPRCAAARGGVYTPSASKHWSSIGLWQLGLQYLGIKANGEYGLDTINAWSPITNIGFGMSNVLVSAINTTQAFVGYFGLGIQQGKFRSKVVESPLTQAVRTFGWIPSYSYGFTAGAHYRRALHLLARSSLVVSCGNMADVDPGNTVVSATLGGYDASRFEPHDTTFNMMANDSNPRVLVRSIRYQNTDGELDPSGNHSDITLSRWQNRYTAVIDSSTPHLWLPEYVCRDWAEAFRYTYNDTLDLYTLSPGDYRHHLKIKNATITFSLTSFDNHNDFGSPLEVPGVVNISVPLEAFVSLLQYPFGGGAIRYGDPAVPYFSLRIAKDNNFILGRSFLQESYLITKFDEGLFSIHQAKFPANPEADAKLMPIQQPRNSPYPPPPQPRSRLGVGQMIGIAFGVFFFCLILLLSLYFFANRRKLRRRLGSKKHNKNNSSSTLASDATKKSGLKILSRITRRKQKQKQCDDAFADAKHDVTQLPSSPSEAPDGQIYELPAPISPVELDVESANSPILDDSELGAAHGVSAYEVARRKLDHQLRGPVPAYTPPRDGVAMALAESIKVPGSPSDAKPNTIVPAVPSSHPSHPSAARSEGGDANTRYPPASEPSPVSPREDWHSLFPDPPSPATVSAPSASSSGTRSWRGKGGNLPVASAPSQASDSAVAVPNPQMPSQRRPLDESRFVCLGSLPENININPQSLLSHAVGTRGQAVATPKTRAASFASEASLGSNYTDEEGVIFGDLEHQKALFQAVSSHVYTKPDDTSQQDQTADTTDQQAQTSDGSVAAGLSHLDPGVDLVHVPQMAAKRYSWEDESRE